MGDAPFRVGDTVEHIYCPKLRLVVAAIWPDPELPGHWMFDGENGSRGLPCQFWNLVPTPPEDVGAGEGAL